MQHHLSNTDKWARCQAPDEHPHLTYLPQRSNDRPSSPLLRMGNWSSERENNLLKFPWFPEATSLITWKASWNAPSAGSLQCPLPGLLWAWFLFSLWPLLRYTLRYMWFTGLFPPLEYAIWRKGLDLLHLCYLMPNPGSEHCIWDSQSTPWFLSHQSLILGCLGPLAIPCTSNTPGSLATFIQHLQGPYLRHPWLKRRTFPLKGNRNRKLKFLGPKRTQITAQRPWDTNHVPCPDMINSKPHRVWHLYFSYAVISLCLRVGPCTRTGDNTGWVSFRLGSDRSSAPTSRMICGKTHAPWGSFLPHLLHGARMPTEWDPECRRHLGGGGARGSVEWQSWVHFLAPPLFSSVR